MSRDNGQGIFTAEFMKNCEKMTHNEAVVAARSMIDGSSARDANKQKAHAMVGQTKNLVGLLKGMWSFSLAHQGLKTIR